MPRSDSSGRAFEYCATECLLHELEKIYPKKVEVTPRAIEAQIRGREQFMMQTPNQKIQFENSGNKITKWLLENRIKTVGKAHGLKIDRIPDQEGVEGDVTDIRIEFMPKEIATNLNISLKHKHTAFKHPRLTRVPLWVGLGEETKKAKEYEKKYEAIWSSFFRNGRQISPNAKRFRDLKALDRFFIERELYKPLYLLVSSFLEENATDSERVKNMFDFMVGKVGFIKFIDNDGKIEIIDFSEIAKPTSVKIEYTDGDYMYMQFDNGFRISGRLHTATEWLKPSIKFDMQPVNLDTIIPVINI